MFFNNNSLHHHGEEHDRAGYNLEELLVLLCSQNESQNTIAMKTFAAILHRINAGEFCNRLVYPEAGERSMNIGEGIVWEMLAMNMVCI